MLMVWSAAGIATRRATIPSRAPAHGCGHANVRRDARAWKTPLQPQNVQRSMLSMLLLLQHALPMPLALTRLRRLHLLVNPLTMRPLHRGS
jgi:hypothetical protein